MQKKSIGFACFRCSFLSFRCCAIYISITAWNCDFSGFLPDFEPFVLVSPDFWICGLYGNIEQLADRLQEIIDGDFKQVHYDMEKYGWDGIALRVADVYENLKK